MKILMINHFPLSGSGSGVYTSNIAKSLVKNGHEVCIIMPEISTSYERYDNIILKPVYFKKDEIISGQLNFNFPCFTTHPYSSQSFYDLTDEQLEEYTTAFKEKINYVVKTFKPDIIHSSHIWLLSLLALQYHVPVVITAHGTDLLGCEKSAKFYQLATKAAAGCQEIITVSEDSTRLVKQFFKGIDDKINYIKNGYDADVFYPTNESREEVLNKLGITKKYDKVVAFAGKLTYIKGIDTLLNAAKIYSDGNTLTLIAGDGELKEELLTLSCKLNLHDIKFLGNVNHDQLRSIYNIASISTIPSRSEAFGLVAIEALACGTPVVGTNQGGIKDFLIPTVGSLVEVDDSINLALEIRNILDNNKKIDRSFVASYARENYAQESLIKNVVDIYTLAISNFNNINK